MKNLVRICLLFLLPGFYAAPVVDIRPEVETETLSEDPDDPALWVNPHDASLSLIVGTVKRPAPYGELAVASGARSACPPHRAFHSDCRPTQQERS